MRSRTERRKIRRGERAKPRDKQKTHERILDSAAKLFRERGVAATSVAEVMDGAGLTVGGFYAHFESKDALVDATLRRAMGELRPLLLRELEAASEWRRLEVVLQRYLSRSHRDDPPGGCPLPAMVSEMTRGSGAGRAALGDELEQNVREIGRSSAPEARGRVLGMLALMYGGVSLARALEGTPLSDEILKACRDFGRAAMRGSGVRPDGEWTG